MDLCCMNTISSCLDNWSRQQPDEILFAYHDRSRAETACYSYAEFAERSVRLAARLRTNGLSLGQRALLIHPPGLELLVALFACCRIGAIPVVAPISSASGWRTAAARTRIAAIVTDCRPTVTLGLQAQTVEQPENVKDSLALCPTDGELAPAPNWRDDPHDIALLQYTSGSTSMPKGVTVTHANIIANAQALLDHAPVGVSWLPQFHDMGLIGFGLFPIVRGGRSHGFAPADFLRQPGLWLRLLSQHRATFAAAPNFAYEYCLGDGAIGEDELAGIDLSALRVMMNGAEPVRPDVCRAFRTRFAPHGLRPDALVAAYGLAEATLAVTAGGYASHVADTNGFTVELASCGRPLPGVELEIRKGGAVCRDGEKGEIHLRGPSITRGYWNRTPRGPREWLATGDLGFMQAGELYVAGRAQDLIIQRGENFHPQDIESVVAGKVRCVAVQDTAGKVLLLCEQAAKGAPLDAIQIANRIAAATGLKIDAVVTIPARAIRRTTSGKLARRQTLEDWQAGLIVPTVEYPVSTRPSATLDLLRRRCQNDPTIAGVRLGDAGMDSLELVQLQLELEEALEALGCRNEAAVIDGPLLQQTFCEELLELADAATAGRRDLTQALVARIQAGGRQGIAAETARMAADAALPLPTPEPRPRLVECGEAVLLTGATGFLGPFLLLELLEQTALPITVLVRVRDGSSARDRVEAALVRAGLAARARATGFSQRVECWPSDLAAPSLGLGAEELERIAQTRYDIVHNGALVDYVRTYDAMRAANVGGTHTLLSLAAHGVRKRFHHVSTTFIFGWTRAGVLYESDHNAGMTGLDFGYSQSKWVAERLVRRAGEQGLPVGIYRPSLISISERGHGDSHDVAARLLAFMIRHRIAVDTINQISLLPVDVVAHNLVAIMRRPISRTATFHATAEHYYSLTELVRQIERDFGFRFDYLPIAPFVDRLNAMASAEDPVLPLLDFFNRAAPHIAAMSLKRYDGRMYRSACRFIPGCKPDPSLAEIAQRMVYYLDAQGWLSQPLRAAPIEATANR
ncbi:thioester reductase domain-containing protein [Sinorhizobium sp. Sb3]|uniref:thioester reductase domain-containing protein n=1 Tax=Sinorhizobium sp. Sb3 TaxID=1358417 RepID=UPI0009E962A0|nr:thioester reductase domain-containing protein [Sinorhizobium sp. Sb3]